MSRISLKTFFLFFLFLLITITVYLPGLSDGFYFDDYPNIVDNQLLHVESPTLTSFWQAAWSGNSSSFGRPLAYLSFSLNSYFSGLDAQAMKVTNLTIHLIVGILLFFLSRMLLGYISQSKNINIDVNLISILTCSIWLIHPINLTCVLYIVQRMASLCALFTILAILCYVYFRIRQIKFNGQWLPLIFFTTLFSLLAFLTKENAVLIIFYLTCIEVFIFRFNTLRNIDKTILKSCFVTAYVIVFAILILFLIFNATWLENGYEYRNFTMSERLFTESRALVWYLRMIITPSITEMGLYLDDFSISTSLFQPLSTIFSISLISLLIILGVRLTKTKCFLISFGIFWFFSGHLLESTIIPLELVFEHRNYLPSFGIFIALAFTAERLLNNKKFRYAAPIACIGWIALTAYTTYARAEQWKTPLQLALYHVENHPDSARAHTNLAGQYAAYTKSNNGKIDQEIFEKTDYHFKKAAMLDPCCSSNLVARFIFYNLHEKKLPPSEFAYLIDSLKHNKIDPGTHIALKNLTFCIIENICDLSTEEYMKVMYAPLSIERADKTNLPYILVSLAEYYAAILNDFDTAIKLIKNVIVEQPKQLNYRFLLVKFLAHSGAYNEAINELKFIQEKDKFGIYMAHSKLWQNLIRSELKKQFTTN